MSSKKNNRAQEAVIENEEVTTEAVEIVEEKVEKAKIVPVESVYPIRDIAANAQVLFGVSPDLALAALLEKQLKECTKAEATEIVNAFKTKEVK